VNLKLSTVTKYARGTAPFAGIPIAGVGTIVLLRRHLQAAIEIDPVRIVYNQDSKIVTPGAPPFKTVFDFRVPHPLGFGSSKGAGLELTSSDQSMKGRRKHAPFTKGMKSAPPENSEANQKLCHPPEHLHHNVKLTCENGMIRRCSDMGKNQRRGHPPQSGL
jgi:hypothetical protein